MLSAVPPPMAAQDSRELSPESMKYVIPTPPAGTKRRPAKKPGSIIDLDIEAPRAIPYDVCIEEVESLDPRKDDKPFIKDFTPQWLSKNGARWPVAADIRVRTFMHDYNVYDSGAQDIKIIDLVKSLRKGTEIETGEAKEFNLFKSRILERISVLAEDMLGKGLLRKVESTLEKTPEFRDVWRNCHSYWGPKHSKSSPKSKSFDIFDMESVPDKDPSSKTPTAKMFSKVHPSSPSSKLMGPPPTPPRRKLNQFIAGSDQDQHQQKKRKTSTKTTSTPALTTPSIDRLNAQPAANAVEEALREDPVTRDNLNFAQEYLSSDTHPNSQTPPQSLLRMQSVCKETRPLTPTSPIVNGTPAEDHTCTTPGRAASVSKFDISPRTLAISPGPLPINISSVPQATSHQPFSTNQRLVLVLEKGDGSLDDDSPLPARHLRDSNVNEFFALVSEVSKKPLELLNCLTFTFIFAPGNELVVKRDDEAEWNKLKRRALLLFKLYRTRLDETEFQLVVEIGDKKNFVTETDAMWGA